MPLRAPNVIHRKLHDMVDDPKRRDYVRWAKDGRSFVITDEEKFERNLAGVLPGLSFMVNMGNFHRELANYGFKKPDAHKLEFEHEGFVRGADETELSGCGGRKTTDATAKRHERGWEAARDRESLTVRSNAQNAAAY